MFSYSHLDALRAAELERLIPRIPPGARVLDVGAGTGSQAAALAQQGFVVTAIELPDSAYAAHRVFPILDYDGRNIPVPDASIDVVFSSNVLEHVPDLTRLHAEIRRVLVPGGRCLHVMPTDGWRWWTTITSLPDAAVYALTSLPALVPHRRPVGAEAQRLRDAWYTTARRIGGRVLQRRHGARGNIVSELWLFRPAWWRRHFVAHGFNVVSDWPLGFFYTGNMLLGARLDLPRRVQLARWLGSACHVFELAVKP